MSTSSDSHVYLKPYKTVEEQLDLLIRHGMQVAEPKAAKECLARVGYYRLSGYWYPFRKSRLSANPLTGEPLSYPNTNKKQRIVEDNFLPGTTFKQVMDLYVFDKRLRLLILDAIERIEVALRVDIALLLGRRDPWAHREARYLHGNFTKKRNPPSDETGFDRWLQKLDAAFDRSREEFVKHFKAKYRGEKPPIWIAIELWDFGMLSTFLGGMKRADQEVLAARYRLSRSELLTKSCRNFNNIRNICAHHGRLWNRSPADQIVLPKQGEASELDYLVQNISAQSRLYGTVAFLQFFLKTIHPGSSWAARLKQHCATFPLAKGVSLSQAGFPKGWESFPLWNGGGFGGPTRT